MRAIGFRHPAAYLALTGVLFAIASLAPPLAHALSCRTLFAPTGAATGDLFGARVASAGDVNGDGHPDVIVGAYHDDAAGADAGAAYVYFGGPGADSVADLTLLGAAAGDEFGRWAGSAGDVNGDGYGDVIVSAYLNDAAGADAGAVYVYFGGPGADAVADLTLLGAAAGDGFGTSASGAGDVNGDGYGDVVVGVPSDDEYGDGAGRAYMFFGGAVPDAVADLILPGYLEFGLFGYAVGTAGDVNDDGYDDAVVGSGNTGVACVYLGGASPDSVYDHALFTPDGYDWFGRSVGTAGDVNGDGYADVIVGAYYDGARSAGAAYVFFGPELGIDPDMTLLGRRESGQFGVSVGTAGDLDGDGCDDVIVGSKVGAFAYYGGAVPDTTADLSWTGETGAYFGYSVATAGDVDGDGHPDLVVGAPWDDAGGTDFGRAYVIAVYPYQLTEPNGGEQWIAGTTATVRWWGHDLADVALSTDDGGTWTTLAGGVGGAEQNAVDVAVPLVGTDLARVRVSMTGMPVGYSTSDTSDGAFRIVVPPVPPVADCDDVLTVTGRATNDEFGISVAGAGDVNGDGFADFIVGARSNDVGGSSAGQAYVYYGGSSPDATADLTLTGAAAGDWFGGSVGTAGDINGDGYDDVVVGAQANDAGGSNAGAAYVYYGGARADATADLTLHGAVAGDHFGGEAGTAGDVNGDGYADLVVGAYGAGAGGEAYVYYGGGTPDATADLTLTAAAADDYFGRAVGGAGDVNGDGYDDVIVGAFYNDAGGAQAGAAYVYFGGASPNATPDMTLVGEAAGHGFGVSVGTAGDVNGDGYDDVIVGAYLNDAGATDAGRAYIFFGGASPDAVADVVLTGVGAGDYFGLPARAAGDPNGDGYGDVIVGAYYNDAGGTDAGAAYVYYGGMVPDSSVDLVFQGATGDLLGRSVACAGDVDGDGFDDLIVGALLADAGVVDAGAAYLRRCRPVGVDVPGSGESGPATMLRAPWPNPARSAVWLALDLAQAGAVTLTIHDIAGREVARPIPGEWRAAGTVTRLWQPGRLRPGVYLVRAAAGGVVETRRLVWLGGR